MTLLPQASPSGLMQFGRWTVLDRLIRYDKRGKRVPYAKCSCVCGAVKIIAESSLVSGASSSCGCLRREQAIIRTKTHGCLPRKEYQAWRNMLNRCTNPRAVGYCYYGGRGIKVCERWRQYEKFLADMGLAPSAVHTIERKDVNAGYTPANCCWLLRSQQARNTRASRIITHAGSTCTLVEWSERTGGQS